MTKQTPIKVDRFDDDKPRRFTLIGGYPIFYVTKRGQCLCPDCAGAEEATDPTAIVAQCPNWEDPTFYCDACGERIESAYAEDDVTP